MDCDDRLSCSETNGDQNSLSVLPDELILHILQFLKFREILNLISCLNKKFYELSKDPNLIPKSLTLNLFRAPSHEKNVRNREQVADIITRASHLKTLSIELNNACDLNAELQLIGNGLCKVDNVLFCTSCFTCILLRAYVFCYYDKL